MDATSRNFREAFSDKEKFGRVFNEEEIRELGIRLDIAPFIFWANRRVAFSRRMLIRDLPQVTLGFLDSMTPQAYALAHGRVSRDREYFVAITKGMLLWLRVALFRLLATKEFLPEVGDSSAERSELPTLPISNSITSLFKDESDPWAEGFTIFPQCPIRLTVARSLVAMTYTFLFDHELRHIVAGHLDYRQSLSSQNYIGEASTHEIADFQGLINQATEYDADCVAACYLISGQLKLSKPKFWDAVPSIAMVDIIGEEDTLLLCLVALSMFFRLCENGDMPSSKWANSTHPPHILRMIYIYGVVHTFLEEKSRPDLSSLVDPLVSRIVQAMASSTKNLLGRPIDLDYVRKVEGKEGQAHYAQIVATWKKIEDDLESFSYIPFQVIRDQREKEGS